MDKEKQIEEIDGVIRGHFGCQYGYKMDFAKYGGFDCYKAVFTSDIAKDIHNADYHKVVRCKDCIHRLTTNCALYCSTYTDKNGTKTYFNGACHSDDFYCAYGVKKPE